jgi:DNA primase|tara:strand:+ start:10578 stop:11462 length:885 start_codon:yes stop_codon:yes gene_type:complete
MDHDIIKILEKRGIEYEKNPNTPTEIKIKCISGLHEDSNPSLSFNLDKNIFNCFSCGYGGNYKKLLKDLGENTFIEFDTKQGYKIKKLKDKLVNKYYASELKMPTDMINFRYDFKGVRGKILQEFGAFVTKQHGLSDYICFPISQYGKTRFIEGRYKILNIASESPKYLRKPANAVVTDLVFPLDKVSNKSHLILVEGLFDMLNLWQYGYKNTVCIFGTNNFDKPKAKLLDDNGVKKCTIFMDNDVSGIRASKVISSLLEANDIETHIVNPPDGKDPGDMSHLELMSVFGEEYE